MVWLRVRRWVVRPVVWAFAVLAVLVFGLSAWLDSDGARARLARLVEREIARVIGRAVAVGSVDFDLIPTRLVVRDLVIPGDARDRRPFLEAREVAIDIDTDALRHDLVDLQTVSVRGLRVRVVLHPGGGDNLPRFPRAAKEGGRFAVRIGGLFVEDGELELADRRVPLDLAARAVMVRLVGLGGATLQGNVTAQEVETLLPGARPWPAAVSGKIRIESDRVEILSARVASAWLDARARGTIGWAGGTHGEIHARVDSSGAWLDERGWLDGEIDGDFRFDGALRFARRDLRIEGDLVAPRARLFGFEVADLAGRVEGGPDGLACEIVRGSYRGGAIGGRFAVDLAAKEQRGHLELRVDGVPVDALLADLQLPPFRLASTARGELLLDFPFGDARRGKGLASLELSAVGASNASPRAEAKVPADGIVGVVLDGGAIEIGEIALQAGAQRISGTGVYDLLGATGHFDVLVRSGDLRELARVQPFVPLEPWPVWLPTAGEGELRSRVRLERGDASADFELELAAVEAPGIVADRVRGSLGLAPDRIHDLDLELLRGGARLGLSGTLPLDGGAAGAARATAPSADLTVLVEGWPVEEARAWVPLALPLTGPAHGTLRLTGPLDDTSGDLVGFVSPVVVAGVSAERLEAALTWNAESLTVARASLTTPAGGVEGQGELRFAGERLDFRVASSAGGLALSRPPFADLWGDGLSGRLTVEATVGGTVAMPEGRLSGAVEGLTIAGRALEGDAPIRLAGALTAGELDVDLALPGLLELRGGGPFTPGETARLDFTLASPRLDRWAELAAAAPVPGLTGELSARLAVRQENGGPLAAELVADRLDLALDGRALRLIEPARLRFAGDRLRIDSLYLGGGESSAGAPAGPSEVAAETARRDELFVSGEVVLGEAARLDLNVQAEASVDWIESLTGLDFDGRLELLSRIGGSPSRPELNGEAALHEARFIPPTLPHTVDRIEALALFYPDAIVLDAARGEFAGGSLAAFGRVDLPRADRELDYRFQMAIDDATVRYPAGFLLRGGGELTLQATEEGRQVRGEIELARIDYVQDIDLSPIEIVQRFLTRTRLQVDETDELRASTYLSLAIQAPGALRVRNNLARIDGGVDLALRGTLANPVLFGEVTTREGGTITYAGNDYEIERAELVFANPSRIVPVVDFVARTRIDDYDVRIAVGGSLDRLTTSFGSNPPLAEYDVLALLATGTASGEETFGGTSSDRRESGALAAESLLYGQAAALIGSRVGTLFGVDRLQIEPLTTGDTVSAARVTVGKRLSRKVYVTYSVDPSSTAQQILEVEWRLSNELTLVMTQNGDGSYALDARWGRRF